MTKSSWQEYRRAILRSQRRGGRRSKSISRQVVQLDGVQVRRVEGFGHPGTGTAAALLSFGRELSRCVLLKGWIAARGGLFRRNVARLAGRETWSA